MKPCRRFFEFVGGSLSTSLRAFHLPSEIHLRLAWLAQVLFPYPTRFTLESRWWRLQNGFLFFKIMRVCCFQ